MAYNKVPSFEEVTKDVPFVELPDGSSREHHDSLPDGLTFDELPDDISLAEDDVKRMAANVDGEALLLELQRLADLYAHSVTEYNDAKKRVEAFDQKMSVAFAAVLSYAKTLKNGV